MSLAPMPCTYCHVSEGHTSDCPLAAVITPPFRHQTTEKPPQQCPRCLYLNGDHFALCPERPDRDLRLTAQPLCLCTGCGEPATTSTGQTHIPHQGPTCIHQRCQVEAWRAAGLLPA